MFLHASLLHLAFNMVALYWLGTVVEQAVGTWRYLLIYLVSGIAGSAGALVFSSPFAVTVGAVRRDLRDPGALLVLEYRATGSFAGPALGLIVINLALSFVIPNISWGGHVGGLVGGILATFALLHFQYARPRSLGPVLVVLIMVASIVVAYVRVQSYVLARAHAATPELAVVLAERPAPSPSNASVVSTANDPNSVSETRRNRIAGCPSAATISSSPCRATSITAPGRSS